MMNNSIAALLILAHVSTAQYGPPREYGPWSGSGNPSNGGSGGNNGFTNNPFGRNNSASFISNGQKILIAHAVLASLAFVLFFPLGSILIRLGSFRGLWIVHGAFQLFAYAVYIAAFGIGIWIVQNVPVDLLNRYHPIIGIVVFVLLFFQPFLGLLHHYAFKKYRRRTVWSYGHLWLGRIVITLGIVNGGLGLLLASETGFYAPSKGQVIAYGVVAGFMWLLWVIASVVGERRRARSRSAVVHDSRHSAPAKEEYA